MSLLDIFGKNTSSQERFSQHEGLNEDLRNLERLKNLCRSGSGYYKKTLFNNVIAIQEWKHQVRCKAGHNNAFDIGENWLVKPLNMYKKFRNDIESRIKSISTFTDGERRLAERLLEEIDLTYEVGVAKRLMRGKANNDGVFAGFASRRASRQMEKVLQMAENMGKSDKERDEIERKILYSLRHKDRYKKTSDTYFPLSLTDTTSDFNDAVSECIPRIKQEIEADLSGNDLTVT